MNRTYNIVWSQARNAFIVASEHAKANGKPSSTRKGVASAVAGALLAMAAAPAMAVSSCMGGGATQTVSATGETSCALTPNDTLVVTATGSIAATPLGVTVQGINAGSITVDALGSIAGATSGIKVSSTGSLTGSITNRGTITGSFRSGINLRSSTVTGLIENLGTSAVIHGAANAIQINSNSSLGGITNNGTLSGNGQGISVLASTITGLIDNQGASAVINGLNAIFLSFATIGGITNSGTISSSSNGNGIGLNGGSTVTGDITNSNGGVISGLNAIAISGSNIAGSIANSGTISGNYSGILVGSTSAITGGITNNTGGTISAVGAIGSSAYAIYLASGSSVGAITNHGTISVVGNPGSSTSAVAGIVANRGAQLTSIVNTGTIQSTLAPGGSASAVNAGILVVGNGSTIGSITNSGTISGQWDGIRVQQNGAITGGIDNQAQGIIEGSRGITIRVGSLTGGITNAGTIRATGAAGDAIGIRSGSVTGNITNSGTISSSGGYAIAIDAASTMTGSVINNSGGLIDGGLNILSATNVSNAGTITLPAGTTSTIGGNYTQTAGGVNDKGLSIGVTDDTTYGKLVVTGTATLPTNAKFYVNAANPNFAFTTTSMTSVLTAGTLTWDGTSVVTDNSVLFDFTATKNANVVDLNLVVAGSGGGGGGSTGVATAVTATGNTPGTGAASVLDGLVASFAGGGTGNADMDTVIGALGGLTTNQQVSSAVSSTLPLMTGGMAQATSANLHGVNHVIQARMEENRGLSSGDEFVGNRKAWLKPLGSWANQNDTNGISGYKAQTYGVALGADTELSQISNIGAAFAMTHSAVNSNSGVQSSGVNSYQAVLYGSRTLGERTEFNWAADYGYNQNKGNRHIAFVNRSAAADYTSSSIHLGAGIGRAIPMSEKNTFTPSFRADYTSIKDNGYTETGAGALNLVVNGKTTDEFILAADGKIAHALSETSSLTANLGVGYDTQAKQSSITAAFQGGGAAFTTTGIKPSATVVRGGLGMAINTRNAVEITARYDIEARTGFIGQTASVKLRMPF